MRRNHRAAPRTMPAFPTEEVVLELPPALPTSSTNPTWVLLLQIFGIVGGVAGTVAYTFLNKNNASNPLWWIPLLTGFMMVASIGSVVNQLAEPRRRAKALVRRSNDYRNYLNDSVVFIDTLAETQRREHESVHPTIEECLNICANPQLQHPAPRMWERWRTGSSGLDFLHCRVGLGRIPATYRVRPASTPSRTVQSDPLVKELLNVVTAGKTVPGAGVTIPLPEIGVLGVHGDGADNVLRVIVVQLVTHHSPSDVSLSLLANERQHAQWVWMRWLPHIWGENNSRRLLGASLEDAQSQISMLIKLIQQRNEQARETNNKYVGPAHVAIFVDADVFTHREDVFRQFLFLLNHGPSVGVYVIILSSQQLPRECRGIIEIQSISARYLENLNTKEVVFTPDQVSIIDVERLARAIAPWESTSLTSDSAIPERVSLMELLGVTSVEKFPFVDRWQRNKPWESLAVPIGLGSGNMPVFLDVQKHGPHGLGAGTTGSGKSEFLLTFIAMLAANFSPSEVIFMLIDFKGEGMSRRVAKLPHLAGVLSNLAASQTNRILISLNAELNRRQRLFKEFSISDINEYLNRRRDNTSMPVLPMMLIIADEFAQLKDEQPEFIDQLVGAARIGRSLGIRLLLTTQNPSGVVTKQIATNTSYRFCLKVASRDDSMDLIGNADAAYLPGRGAGFLKMGEGQPIQFQSGYTGEQYSTIEVEAPVINVMSVDGKRTQIVGPRVRMTEYTQLDYLVNHIQSVAVSAGFGGQYKVWAPPLPDEPPVLGDLMQASGTLSSWNESSWQCASEEINVVVGLYDDPANQSQNLFVIPITERNNIAVYVGPGEGRNLFTRTFIGSLVQNHSPRDIQLLLMDFGAGGSLKAFEDLPHTIVVANPNLPEILNRVNSRLIDELAQRARVLNGLTFASYRKSVTSPLPRIIIVIDNIVELRDQPSARTLHETIERVAQNGAPLGIHLVVILNVPLEASAKIRQQFGMTIGLGVPSDMVYDMTNKRNLVIDATVIGRGVASVPACEVQIAALAKGGEVGQLAAIQQLSRVMGGVDGLTVAHQIREIPERLTIQHIQKLQTNKPTNPFELAIALNTETESADSLILGADGNTLLVTGSPKSGKSTLLHTILQELYALLPVNKLKVFILSIGETLLYNHQHNEHTAAYETVHTRLKGIVEQISVAMEPHKKLYQNELDNGNPITRSQILDRLPAIVLIIDTDKWSEIVSSPIEVKQHLVALITTYRELGLFVLVAADSEQIKSAKVACELTALLSKQQYIVLNIRDEADFALISSGYMSVAEREGHKSGMRPGRGLLSRSSGKSRLQFGIRE